MFLVTNENMGLCLYIRTLKTKKTEFCNDFLKNYFFQKFVENVNYFLEIATE